MSVVIAEQVQQGTLTVLPAEEMPQHIAIIMDGNGRWAQRRHMPRTFGHRAGVEALHRIVEECGRLNIPMLTVYAFSTENWSRPQTEVTFLMRLLAESFSKYLDRLIVEGVHIRHLGRKDRLPGDLLKRIAAAEEATAKNMRLHLNVALDYGARAELTEAIRAMARDGIDLRHVTEEQISSYLYTKGLPDPDLIIRTGGEVRLSNFLLWQAAYAEYYSTEKCWPDFEAQDLRQALLAFLQRQRRFGGVVSHV